MRKRKVVVNTGKQLRAKVGVEYEPSTHAIVTKKWTNNSTHAVWLCVNSNTPYLLTKAKYQFKSEGVCEEEK